MMNRWLSIISAILSLLGVIVAPLEGSNFVTRPLQWADIQSGLGRVSNYAAQYVPDIYKPAVQKYFLPTVGLGIGALGAAGLWYKYVYKPKLKSNNPSTNLFTSNPLSPNGPSSASSSSSPDPFLSMIHTSTPSISSPEHHDRSVIELWNGLSKGTLPLSNLTEKDLVRRDAQGATLAHIAAHEAPLQRVRALVRLENNIPDAQGLLPLHHAVARTDKKAPIITQFLLERTPADAKFACIQLTDGSSGNALNFAVEYGTPETVELLLQSGFRSEAVCPKQDSPLGQAILRNSPEIVDLLIEYGANPNRRIFLYPNALFYLLSTRSWRTSSQNLIKIADSILNTREKSYLISFATRDHMGATVLHKAVESGDLTMIKYLLTKMELDDPVLYIQNNIGQTALDEALTLLGRNSLEILEALLQKSSDQQLKSRLLSVAIKSESPSPAKVHVLLKSGASPHSDLLFYILKTYPWPNRYVADRRNRLEIVKDLIDFGVDLTKTDEEGKTPKEIAQATNDPELIALFN